jgi:hypothetical protein
MKICLNVGRLHKGPIVDKRWPRGFVSWLAHPEFEGHTVPKP